MTQAAILAASASPGTTTGFKNKIINGNMAIDQRNAGASVSATNGGYYIDRWGSNSYASGSVTGKFTVQQNAGAVTPPAGFTNYLGVTSSAATSISTNDVYTIYQWIEGYNIADLGWGTANAKTVTLSFWVRSSLTGTFGGAIMDTNSAYNYPFSYTIAAANTWEQKSVTIVGPTSGTFPTTNGAGLAVRFGLGAGSAFSGTGGAWTATANTYTVTGAVSVVSTSGATFYITGVQLEVGTTATNFDFRSYGTELALCQRYFQKSYNTNEALGTVTTTGCITNQAQANVTFVPMIWNFPVIMRATPTLTAYSTNTGTAGKFYSNAPAGDFNISAGFIGASGGSVNSGGTSITATGYVATQLAVTAEL